MCKMESNNTLKHSRYLQCILLDRLREHGQAIEILFVYKIKFISILTVERFFAPYAQACLFGCEKYLLACKLITGRVRERGRIMAIGNTNSNIRAFNLLFVWATYKCCVCVCLRIPVGSCNLFLTESTVCMVHARAQFHFKHEKFTYSAQLLAHAVQTMTSTRRSSLNRITIIINEWLVQVVHIPHEQTNEKKKKLSMQLTE